VSQFVRNIAAAVDALGIEPVGVIYGIGMTAWDSDQDRDDFLQLITGGQRGQGNPDNPCFRLLHTN